MDLTNTAFIFVGYQNDYFAEDGVLRGVIEEADRNQHILENTLTLLEQVKDLPTTLIQTPIIFTDDYSELTNPVGILKAVKDANAFREGTKGGDTIDSFKDYGERILTVHGKRGLNAFSNTELEKTLDSKGIKHVVLAGAVTSICIDSTGRAAHERGYSVSILSDCTASRTPMEQEFYCENIFPLYAEVLDSKTLLA